MFAIIFVASISLSSPIIKGGRFVYSLLIGIISSVLVNVYGIGYGIYIVIPPFHLYSIINILYKKEKELVSSLL